MGDTYELIKNFQYIIFPGHNCFAGRKLAGIDQWTSHYNLFYDTWKEVWNKTFKELNSSSKPQPSDFMRQSFSGALFNGNQIVGFETSCFFDLNQKVHCEHPYLTHFPNDFLETLRKEGIRLVMTIEYLYVHPHWRSSLASVSFKDILSSLAMKCMLETDADAMIALPRSDKKVNEMIYRRGAKCIEANRLLHNVPVDLICLKRNDFREVTERQEDALLQSYWQNRIDLFATFESSSRLNLLEQQA